MKAVIDHILKASILKLGVVAEGFETEGWLEFLKHHGCPVDA